MEEDVYWRGYIHAVVQFVSFERSYNTISRARYTYRISCVHGPAPWKEILDLWMNGGSVNQTPGDQLSHLSYRSTRAESFILVVHGLTTRRVYPIANMLRLVTNIHCDRPIT